MAKQPFDESALFQAAQKPVRWLVSAERLRDAAELILGDQVKQEVPYFRAVNDARTQCIFPLASSPPL